jgi:hypothetical protein
VLRKIPSIGSSGAGAVTSARVFRWQENSIVMKERIMSAMRALRAIASIVPGTSLFMCIPV